MPEQESLRVGVEYRWGSSGLRSSSAFTQKLGLFLWRIAAIGLRKEGAQKEPGQADDDADGRGARCLSPEDADGPDAGAMHNHKAKHTQHTHPYKNIAPGSGMHRHRK